MSSKINLQTTLAIKGNIGNAMALKFKNFNIEQKKKKVATDVITKADRTTIQETKDEIEKLQKSITKIKPPKHFNFDMAEENAGFQVEYEMNIIERHDKLKNRYSVDIKRKRERQLEILSNLKEKMLEANNNRLKLIYKKKVVIPEDKLKQRLKKIEEEKINKSSLAVSEEDSTQHDLDTFMLMEKAVSERNFKGLVNHWKRYNVNIRRIRDKYGRSILHIAALCGDKDILGFLLGKGLNINEQDAQGNTPLHYTIDCNYFMCTNMLIDLDVDDTIRND